MKHKLFLAFVSLVVCRYCCCQPTGTREYTMAMYKKISGLKSRVAELYKDSFLIRRIETGILENQGTQLFGSTTRLLGSGNEYIVIAFSDSRVSNLTLTAYKEAEGDKWDMINTKNDNTATSSANLIGDIELMLLTPDANASYKFEISSTSAGSKGAARYGILVFSREKTASVSSTSSASTTLNTSSTFVYNIDNYTTCDWDSKKGEYGDWSSPTSYPCSFEINKEETVVTWKKANSVTTFYITDKDKSLDKWINYTVRSGSGDRYTFMTPKSTGQYVRISKLDGNLHNGLTDYHIQSPSSRTSATTKITYSIDNYSTASYDTKKDDYGIFENETTFSCLFEVKADETKIIWRESSGSVTVFDITDKDDLDSKWLNYTIKSQGGNRYRFMIPKNDIKYIRVIKLDGKTHNPLTDYHIVSKWSD